MLVAIITYNQEYYALGPLLDALVGQTMQDFRILVVDNSPEDEYQEILNTNLEKRFAGRSEILRATGTDRFTKILNSRNKVREYFLRTMHKAILMLDSDVIIPSNTIEQFRKSDESLASGIYLNATKKNGKVTICPCIYLDVPGGARQATIAEILKQEKMQIGAAGLGCTYAKRPVLENTHFRLNKKQQGEDIMFYRDAIRNGYHPVAICSIRCMHMHFPLKDQRNKPFDAVKYKLLRSQA